MVQDTVREVLTVLNIIVQLTHAMGYLYDECASILHPFYLKQDSIQHVLSLVIIVNFLLCM